MKKCEWAKQKYYVYDSLLPNLPKGSQFTLNVDSPNFGLKIMRENGGSTEDTDLKILCNAEESVRPCEDVLGTGYFLPDDDIYIAKNGKKQKPITCQPSNRGIKSGVLSGYDFLAESKTKKV